MMKICQLSCEIEKVEGNANGLVYLSVSDVAASDLLACMDDATGAELAELALGLVEDLPGKWVQVEDEDGRPTRDNLARLTEEERLALDRLADASALLMRAFNWK